MSNLFNNAVEAVKNAVSKESSLKAKLAEVEQLAEETASTITVACTEAYAWFISVNRKHGSKAQLAEASGVSQKTVGRYIAGGHVAMVTDGKVEAGIACNAINNYDMKLSEVEAVKTVSDWRKLLKAYKAVNKEGAGKVTGKASTDTEASTEDTDNTDYWVQLSDLLAEEIASGAVTLQAVAEYLTESVMNKELATV